MSVFDVVIVGAGPAGCVLASRLTEDVGRSVCLIEAGPDYGPDVAGWPADLCDPTAVWHDSHPWGYSQAGRPADRPLPLPRARVVGGCSTINACYWLRGSAADYDAWAALGNPGWAFDDLLPYLRRAEADPLGGTIHGISGPVAVHRAGEQDLTPVDRAFATSAETLGLPHVADLNAGPVQQPCVGPMPKNIAAGRRMNASFTYLAPARTRPNLTIVADALVDRVIFDGGRAVGVRTNDRHELLGPEIVLAAGAYGSPAILLRSGIGPRGHLRELGIPAIADRPGVGEHLMDHPFMGAGALPPWTIRPEHAPPARVLTQVAIKARSSLIGSEIDLHIYQVQRFDDVRRAWIVMLAVSLQGAHSQGRLRLSSPKPTADPEIDHRYFSDRRDLEALCDGVALALQLAATPPLADMLVPSSELASGWRTRDDLRARVRERAGTTFHPSGTCRMGPTVDLDSVVDSSGRVHGVAGLTVADASIFPTSPHANLHCTVVTVAEKIADSLRSEGHNPSTRIQGRSADA